MEHSIALVTGATSGLGNAAARLLAAGGCREITTGLVPYKKRVLTAAGVEAAQTPLSGHHQLTVGLLHSPSN